MSVGHRAEPIGTYLGATYPATLSGSAARNTAAVRWGPFVIRRSANSDSEVLTIVRRHCRATLQTRLYGRASCRDALGALRSARPSCVA